MGVHPRISAVPLFLILLSSLLPAQEKKDSPQDYWWEGKPIQDIRGEGFRLHSFDRIRARMSLKKTELCKSELVELDTNTIWKTGLFSKVDLIPIKAGESVIIIVRVQEYEIVETVKIVGAEAIQEAKLETDLRITEGSRYDPGKLQQDHNHLRKQYVEKGYHFARVEPTFARGVLTWRISEGPEVMVESVTITGNEGLTEGEITSLISTRDGSYLFELLRVGRLPFIMDRVKQDLERIKVLYLQKGWLDILQGERVFMSDIRFSRDKSDAFITIHVDEGPRYRVRSVDVQIVPEKGRKPLYPKAELLEMLKMQAGEYFDAIMLEEDKKKLRDAYGERAYINAEVIDVQTFALEGHELDLVYKITEKDMAFVGSLTFTGNSKTRDDVLRREFTRLGFIPGGEFNSVAMTNAVRRLRSKGWFDNTSRGGGVRSRVDKGLIDGTQDVSIDVTEGDTGSIRFAAGYSSAYGILGMVEITQRNFDIADLPGNLGDIFDGDGFSGGGQILNLRVAPARERQSYNAEFIEPYFFGSELQFNIRGFKVDQTRESWDEERAGGSFGFDKRWYPLSIGISFRIEDLEYTDLESDAPTIVRDLEGENISYSLVPAIAIDTRNSALFPSEGFKILLSYEYTGQVLPGDWDFEKYIFDTDFYFPIIEIDDDMRHVLALEFMFGWINTKRRMKQTPISERFFLGGRGTVRGFEFRGIGPRENGDPIGGDTVLFASAEYQFPLIGNVIRGAAFFDAGILEDEIGDLHKSKPRYAVGVGIRLVIPQLGNVPVSLDFAWPLWKDDDDERQTITFDIGRLF